MPETPETHKEIVEIKKEVKEIRQTQDAEIYHSREKWESHLSKLLDENADMMRILLAVDGLKSAKEIETASGFYQVKCWRLLNQLEREGIVYKLEETKKSSPIYVKARWYVVLRLDEKVEKKLLGLTQQATSATASQITLEEKVVSNQSEPGNSDTQSNP